jgi:hypothetical protein
MTSQEVCEALVAWAREQIPELNAGYPYPSASTDALPDVIAATLTTRTLPSDEEYFPFALLEQVWLKEWEVQVSIMVEQGNGEAGAEAAHQTLEGFADTLLGSTVAGVTLGEKVMLSPRATFELDDAFEERADGTRGRELQGLLVAAEPIEVEG